MNLQTNSSSLLSLPAEVRLQILDELLVAKFNAIKCGDHHLDGTHSTFMSTSYKSLASRQRIEINILKVNRQLRIEGLKILHRDNSFKICSPGEFDGLLRKAAENLGLVRKMYIVLHGGTLVKDILRMLGQIEQHATSLRVMYLEFEQHTQIDHKDTILGHNIPIIRAVSQIKQLDLILLDGFYAVNWPSYLERETGAEVRHWWERYDMPFVDGQGRKVCGYEEENALRRAQEAKRLEEWQRGTEGIVP